MDLDGDHIFQTSERQGGITNFTSASLPLDANKSYLLAVAHGEWGGGSRLKPWILTPGQDWRIIDPSDPSQQGYYKVTFDNSISNQLSAFSFYKHGVSERLDFRSGNLGMTHRLDGGSVEISTDTLVEQ